MWILRAAICLAVPAAIAFECKDAKRKSNQDPFLKAGANGVEIWSEVSSKAVGQTFIVREAYDKKSGRYFMEFHDGKTFEKILYDFEAGTTFSYNDFECKKLNRTELQQFYDSYQIMRLLKLEKIPEVGFLGPASLFEKFAVSSELVEESSCDSFDRKIPCVKYTQCAEPFYDFYYTKPNNKIFNLDDSRPLRVVLRDGEEAIGNSVDILDIKLYTGAETLDLFAPTGLSCDSSTKTTPVIPFDTTQREFQAEVVFKSKQTDKSYISQLSGIVIPTANPEKEKDASTFSGIYSFTMSNFFINGNATDFLPGNRRKIIHDVNQGYIYDFSTGKDGNSTRVEETYCRIYEKKDFTAKIELPFYGNFDLTPLLLTAPKAENDIYVTYLGKNRIRFVDTEVYEVTYPLYRTELGLELSRLVVTYHFPGPGAVGLVAVELTGHTNQKEFHAVIHLTRYEEEIVSLNEKLRIDECYDYVDKSELRWFQIGFETKNANEMMAIKDSASAVREIFMRTLFTKYGLEPMRIPRVNVNFVSNQILIGTLLLERTLLETAYKRIPKKDFKSTTKTLGVMSLSACQITCLGMDERECTAITYCGATCSISRNTSPSAPINTIDSDECDLYERSSGSSVKTSAHILRLLSNDITSRDPLKQFKMTVAYKVDETAEERTAVELTAVSFNVTRGYDSVFHYDKNKVPILETSFKMANARKKYSDTAKASRLSSLDIEDCALACRNRKSCESFSHCQNSRECTISEQHDVRPEDLEDDSQCIVYQALYLERFEKLPGLTIEAQGEAVKATTNESCAQKCVSRNDCKSFEFCESSGDCVLLKTHIADTKVSVSKSADPELKCSHYSKQFLFDYGTKADRESSGPESTLLAKYSSVNQATCAKLCSEWADEKTVCLSFDFCAPDTDNTGVCTLRTLDDKANTTENASCDFFYAIEPRSAPITLHGAGASFGFSILMIFVGIGIGIGALYAYNKFREL